MGDATERSTPAWWLRALGTLGLLLLSGLVPLLGLEAALRIAGVGSDQLLRQDPLLGVRFIPGKRGVTREACFEATATINDDGWRGPAVFPEKPPDVLRILALGDSFVAGLQVGDDETVTAVLERLLDARGARRVEVINLGVPSFGNDQEYLALQHFGRRYQPDLVLQFFYAQNDVANNSIPLERSGSAYPKPFFSLEAGELVAVPFEDATPPVLALARELVQPLRAYPWVRDRLIRIPALHRLLFSLGLVGIVPEEGVFVDPGDPLANRLRGQSGAFARQDDATWTGAWEITRALLRRTHEEARAMGAEYLLVGIASPLAVIPRHALARALSAEALASIDVDKPARELTRLAAATGMDFLSLVPAFRARIGASEEAFSRLYLPCDGHWTAAGHRLAAETLAAFLSPRLEAEPRS